MNDNPYDILKAYKSQDFLSSSEARPLRILAEYLEPLARFERYPIDDSLDRSSESTSLLRRTPKTGCLIP